MIITRYCTRKLGVRLDAALLLESDSLDALLSLDAEERGAKERIHAYLHQARRTRHQNRARDRRLLAQRQRSHMRRERRRFEEAEEQGRRAAVQWLVSEQVWEKQVMCRLMASVGRGLADHLQALLPGLDWSDMLAQQLPALIEGMQQDMGLVLRVPDESLSRVTEKLAPLPVRVVPLGQNTADVAVLENDLMRVEIPLSRQFDDILKQLRQLDRCGGDDGRN